LDKLKRAAMLVEALHYSDPEIKCKIVGIGPEEGELRKRVAEHHLSNRVEFLGAVADDELVKLYAECFAVFFAPYDEDYGYVTVEAFLAQRPVITATDSGGPLEFVADGINGFVVRPDDHTHMSQRIESLYFDRKKCQDFGRRGYERVHTISWGIIIEKLVHCHQ